MRVKVAIDFLRVGKLSKMALFRFALDLARRTADEIGCVGVVVDAKPESQAFYLRYGFESFAVLEGALLDRPEPTPMFLPLSAIPSARSD